MQGTTSAPAAAYAARMKLRTEQRDRLARQHVLLGYLRLLLVATMLVLAWLSFYRHILSGWWIVLPCVVFVAVARVHSAVLTERTRTQRALRFYELGMTRIEERWAELQQREPSVDCSESLFARDLDLFGRGGLFNLLCTARTSMGEGELASWLLMPATREETLARQDAVRELRERLELREELASLGDADAATLDINALATWGAATSEAPVPGWLRWIAVVLVLLTLVALGYAFVGSSAWFIAVLVVDATLTYALQRRTTRILAGAERIGHSLGLASRLIERFEREPLDASQLKQLQSRLSHRGTDASHALARLATLAELIDHRRNFIVRVLDAPLLYSVQLAGAVQRWREAHGASLVDWLRVLGEAESLVSLATYSYEHPDDPFAEIVEGDASFQASGLGHPLIDSARCVRNDISLGTTACLLLVSGSNMSGKSTLLRAVGINTVLAMMGAPVRAAKLRLTPLHVGASIQVNDSLQQGRSRFYAEILRLRAICALAEERPVLFLLDELLDGTNSNDRLTGGTGIARALAASGAIGLISTHDLALTEIGANNGLALQNAHFQERIENGEMLFDFKLREGPVTTKNGLALMRMVGLKV